ncbi:hypothetical protein [Candidatus Contendibacter odensensis]|uniref:Uncharacterized protein n=1 Tax=Candidatus Contendobacter odensis Run_B_J11 TaxID=1400861 RepID=A0A7U7GD79_9GAMM|nr:hypothetical protein [Candidatus Contendobacter odensis]CDH46195.1 hypothetical protein BN874_390022 [Candidatus Contendobacter odensis Run_B_J11]
MPVVLSSIGEPSGERAERLARIEKLFLAVASNEPGSGQVG